MFQKSQVSVLLHYSVTTVNKLFRMAVCITITTWHKHVIISFDIGRSYAISCKL